MVRFVWSHSAFLVALSLHLPLLHTWRGWWRGYPTTTPNPAPATINVVQHWLWATAAEDSWAGAAAAGAETKPPPLRNAAMRLEESSIRGGREQPSPFWLPAPFFSAPCASEPADLCLLVAGGTTHRQQLGPPKGESARYRERDTTHSGP
jgi:hypothetical protein